MNTYILKALNDIKTPPPTLIMKHNVKAYLIYFLSRELRMTKQNSTLLVLPSRISIHRAILMQQR